MDRYLDLTPDTRYRILDWGDLKLNPIKNESLICTSGIFSFPMTIPALDPKPTKYSSSTLRTFKEKINKGSQEFRTLLTREE